MRLLRLYRTTFAAARLFNKSSAGKIISRSLRSKSGRNSANSHIKISKQPMNSSFNNEEEFPPLSVNKGVKSKRRNRVDLVTCSRQQPEPEVAQNVVPLQHEEANSEGVHKLDPLQCESPTMILDHNNMGLPTSFGKKPSLPSRSPKLRQNDHDRRGSKNVVQLQRGEANLNFDPLQCESPTKIIDHNDMGLPTSFRKKPSFPSRSPKLRQNGRDRQDSKRLPKPSSVAPVDEPFDVCPHETTESTTRGGYVNTRNKQMWSPMREPAEENEQNQSIAEKGSNSEVLGPGMVLLKRYIPLSEQVNIVNKCRELGCGRGGFYRPGYNDGAKLRLYMMCLGLDWDPQTARYAERRRHDNAAPPALPSEFTSLVCRALDDSHDLIKRKLEIDNVDYVLPKMSPDVCIVNFYTSNGRLGLHQDRDETWESLDRGLPVVSVSIGDSAEFLYGKRRDVDKAKSVELESGDVLIFGGESRHIYHGVKAIVPDTAPPGLLESTRLRPGRLNLTFRKY